MTVLVKLPDDLGKKLEERAKRNRRTIRSETIWIVEQALKEREDAIGTV